MNIVHLCLSCFYIDGGAYQENKLISQHVCDGHSVIVIASTENHDENGKLYYEKSSVYLGKEGAKVYRLDYHALIPNKIRKKLRIHKNVFEMLSNFNPDVILFHGLCGWELLTVAKYKKANPLVKLYADSHEDWNNSARNFISREVLHKLYYKNIIKYALPYIEKILCVSVETMDFVKEVYKIDKSKLEFFPLGGHPVPNDKYYTIRKIKRRELGLDNETVFIQSGKQTKRKKLIECLKAFSATEDKSFHLYIVGSLFDDIKKEATFLIEKDSRITFLGWQPSSNLNQLLCAADIYLQPGTQSVTMQHSLCAHCAVIIDDVPSHKPYINNNGWLINEANPLASIFNEVTLNKERVEEMKNSSYLIASKILDYKKLAQRIFS